MNKSSVILDKGGDTQPPMKGEKKKLVFTFKGGKGAPICI